MDYELTTRSTIRNIGTSFFANYELYFRYTLRYNGTDLDVEVRQEGYRSFQEAKNIEMIMSSIVEVFTERMNIPRVNNIAPIEQNLGA